MDNENIHSVCWYCKSVNSLVWNNDFNYDEVFGEGDGIVSFLTCRSCGAEVQYSIQTDSTEQ